MFTRNQADNGVVFYTSSLLTDLGVPHGFSTRIGGVSQGPFNSLSFAMFPITPLPKGSRPDIQDTRENVMENYIRFKQAVGVPHKSPTWSEQMHANDVCIVDATNAHEKPKVDAIITQEPNLLATIRVADCMPILISDDAGTIVAAIHSGWKGTVLNVIQSTVRAMFERSGVMPSQLVAAVGPSIGVNEFEVSQDTADKFHEAGYGLGVVQKPEWVKPHIDLFAVARAQLLALGLDDARIDISNLCTASNEQDFFSHRRDRGMSGRMVAVIGTKS